MITFDGEVVFCSDVRASAAFYDQLGLVQDWADDDHISFHLPTRGHTRGAWLLLHPMNGDHLPHSLGTFTVPDVDQLVGRLHEAGYRILTEPADQPWGVREANVVDPDGNGLTLTTVLQALIVLFVAAPMLIEKLIPILRARSAAPDIPAGGLV